jgi:hypothetical protein
MYGFVKHFYGKNECAPGKGGRQDWAGFKSAQRQKKRSAKLLHPLSEKKSYFLTN